VTTFEERKKGEKLVQLLTPKYDACKLDDFNTLKEVLDIIVNTNIGHLLLEYKILTQDKAE
jgi:hypothetical protein